MWPPSWYPLTARSRVLQCVHPRFTISKIFFGQFWKVNFWFFGPGSFSSAEDTLKKSDMRSRLAEPLKRASQGPKWRASSLPADILRFQYAVRGELAIKAQEYDLALSAGKKLPFERVVFCNIGNPQQLQQKPITFYRQVENTELLSHPKAPELFPSDVIERAHEFIKSGPSGAYTDSRGTLYARKTIARFICERDGQPNDGSYVDPNHIYMSNGASPAIQDSLRMIIRNEKDGILIPIPQYPLYSGSVPLIGGQTIGYYLDEESNWGLRVSELDRAIKQARGDGLNPRALVVINPGNPTGSCLSEKNIVEVLEFADKEDLIVLADEVYQRNVYQEERPFVSFKKVLHKVGSRQELLSFYSISKGLTGECGKRGGYVEMTNVADEIHEQFYKLMCMSLCSNTVGQMTMALMVNPPKEGDPSYPRFRQEEEDIYNSLKRRSNILYETLNSLEGVSCQKPDGALYVFPKITLPPKAIAVAKEKGKTPDTLYCLELLDETGLCVVPGSGFGQVEGTWHFRITILPQEKDLEQVLQKLAVFHQGFLKRYQ